MRLFLLRRLLQVVPLLLGISALTFLLLQLAPGDFLGTMAENPQISTATLEAMRHRFGLDQPWWVQYGLYLRNLFLRFDFGESFSRHQPVFTVLREGLGNTLMLATAAAVVTWCLAIPLGVIAAVRQFTWVDKTLSVFSFIAEIIFSWPGLGRITLDALLTKDQYLVMGSVLMAAAVLVAGNLVADLLLAIADPRIAYD